MTSDEAALWRQVERAEGDDWRPAVGRGSAPDVVGSASLAVGTAPLVIDSAPDVVAAAVDDVQAAAARVRVGERHLARAVAAALGDVTAGTGSDVTAVDVAVGGREVDGALVGGVVVVGGGVCKAHRLAAGC